LVNYIFYIVWMAFLNSIRGGILKPLWDNTMAWKIVAAIGVVAATILFLKQSVLFSVGLGVMWFMFMLPTWGAWIDMGHFPPEYLRGGVLKPLYQWLGNHIQSQETVDTIMLTVRGLLCILIFGWIVFMQGTYISLTLVIPTAIMWAYGYNIAWRLDNPNLGEYISGAFLGIGILLAIGF